MSDDNSGNFFAAENFNEDDDESSAENWNPVKVNSNALFKMNICQLKAPL